MKKNKCAVVIPLYSTILKQNELISLEQVKKILSKYQIIAVVPDHLEIDKKLFSCVEKFDSDYFTSVNAYNRLMLSSDFYNRFAEYEYILIYQLDAFVFFDYLYQFCDLGYDYIGAPWLHGVFNYIDSSHYFWYVGNGGLSLRKVSGFMSILKERKPLLGEQIINEDLFFSSIVDKNFKVAPIDTALQFAFERQVERCFELNKRQLPFGCHAWQRYNLEFWKPYIERFGYEVKDISNAGCEDILRSAEYLLWERFSKIVFGKYGIKKANDKVKDLFKQTDNTCIIFGAGFYGNSLSRWLTDIGIGISFFCDNSVWLEGKTLNGISVIHTDKLLEKKNNSLIVIMSYQHENEIAEQLILLNLKYRKDFITFTDFVNILERG